MPLNCSQKVGRLKPFFFFVCSLLIYHLSFYKVGLIIFRHPLPYVGGLFGDQGCALIYGDLLDAWLV